MKRPLEITSLTKTFPTPSGPYTAVKDFNIRIDPGEFVCLLGHSGCGKSTVLAILAGLQKATAGGVVIEGKEVDEPGLDRGVVFQSPSLLPWMSVEKNVQLACNKPLREVRHFLDIVGVADVAEQLPPELSLGTQQRVAIARALSTTPKILLLDEPFGMLDSLTRCDLQDALLAAWEQHRTTVVMVTHDVNEALYVSDRIVLMTDGPEATVGRTIEVPFLRPRSRAAVMKSGEYRSLRGEVMDFLELHAKHIRVH